MFPRNVQRTIIGGETGWNQIIVTKCYQEVRKSETFRTTEEEKGESAKDRWAIKNTPFSHLMKY